MRTWKTIATGYVLVDGWIRTSTVCRLEKADRKWTLVLADGRVFAMPARPTFDHAEGILARLGV